MYKPLIVGITGGIGGGKSTLARILCERGYVVYDTDREARRLQNENAVIRQKLTDIFGHDIYTEEGLNRKLLAGNVFNNPSLLKQLNEIVHPIVRQDFFDWQKQHAQEKYLFVESAIMFESGLSQFTDKVIVVTAPEDLRIMRVMKRDNISPEEVLKRMKNQLPEEEKIARADIVVDSSGKTALTDNVDRILAELSQG